MVAVLVVIAALNAWTALVDGELPRFHLTIAAVALILAVIVAVSRYDFPVRSEPETEQTRDRRPTGRSLVLFGALASVLWVTFGPWRSRADFDVTGFLFVVQNIPQLVVLGFFAGIACVGGILASRLGR
jgi:hypothetical protein